MGEGEYMATFWQSLSVFANNMANAQSNLNNARKRRASQLSQSSDEISTSPPRKKPKKSHPSISKSSKKKKSKKKTRKKPKIKLPTWASSSTSSPKNKKKTGKIIKYDSSKQYKLRRPKSAWMLFNAFKIAQLKSQYPDEQLGARTKRSSKIWQSMNDDAKSEWNEKALAERLKWEKVKKAFSVHGDYSKVPGRWLAVDKKTKKSDEKKEKSASPKKKKVTSPKKKTVKKRL